MMGLVWQITLLFFSSVKAVLWLLMSFSSGARHFLFHLSVLLASRYGPIFLLVSAFSSQLLVLASLSFLCVTVISLMPFSFFFSFVPITLQAGSACCKKFVYETSVFMNQFSRTCSSEVVSSCFLLDWRLYNTLHPWFPFYFFFSLFQMLPIPKDTPFARLSFLSFVEFISISISSGFDLVAWIIISRHFAWFKCHGTPKGSACRGFVLVATRMIDCLLCEHPSELRFKAALHATTFLIQNLGRLFLFTRLPITIRMQIALFLFAYCLFVTSLFS